MKVLRLAEFGVMEVRQSEVPIPEAGEVLLRIVATGICGSDLHGISGANGRRQPGQVMGHETVGRVEAVGRGVAGFEIGSAATVNPVLPCGWCHACRTGYRHRCPDRRIIGVTPDIVSAFAEFLVVPAANVVPLPAEMPIEYGALVEPLAVAYHGVRRGQVGPKDRVLVIGGGPIGQSAILAAVRMGSQFIAVMDLDDDRLALCDKLGALPIWPMDEEADDPYAGEDDSGNRLPELAVDALGGLATVTIDAVGSSQTLAAALRATAEGGRVVLLGMQQPELTIPAYDVSTGERTIIGSFCYTADDFRHAAAWAGSAPPEFASLISQQVDVDDAPSTITDLLSGNLPTGKVLVRFTTEAPKSAPTSAPETTTESATESAPAEE